MGKLVNYDIVINIEQITNISGADQYFEVTFSAKNGMEFKIIFDQVWDMRWSIENASIERFCNFREFQQEELIKNSIYVVEDSEYIGYFEKQVSGTRPIDKLRHFIIYDNVNTTLDILSNRGPTILKI